MSKLQNVNSPHSSSVEFASQDFVFISELAKREFGLNLSETKKPLIQSRVSKRMRDLKIDDFASYRKILESKANRDEEVKLLSVLTTNVTSFFRENHHFNYLKDGVERRLRSEAQLGAPIRVWSAASSSGQEVYSIAMTLAELCSAEQLQRIQFFATDIDPVVVEIGKKGVYPLDQLQQIPHYYQKNFTEKLDAEKFRISGTLVNKVNFKIFNLIKPVKQMGFYDFIFCRNAAIYFDHETQSTLWANLSSALRPGGQIYIGHSERIHGIASESLESCGITAYRRL